MPNYLDLVPSKYVYIYTLLMIRVRAIFGIKLIRHKCCVANLSMPAAGGAVTPLGIHRARVGGKVGATEELARPLKRKMRKRCRVLPDQYAD